MCCSNAPRAIPARSSAAPPYLQPAHVMASDDIVGQVLPVTIHSLERYSLIGELAIPQPARPPQPLPVTTGA